MRLDERVIALENGVRVHAPPAPAARAPQARLSKAAASSDRKFNPAAFPLRRAEAPGAGAEAVSQFAKKIGLMFIVKKVDLSKPGHWSGTGMIVYG